MSTASYYRFEGIQRFEKARRRAQFCALGLRLAKRPGTLLPFAPIYSRLSVANGIPHSIEEIAIDQIVGSLSRATDYDRFFRPLRDSQRGRWVNMWVQHQLGGWDPIIVRQIGNLYFVEDGHHRTSVARSAGLTGIVADVIEYPLPLDFDPLASLASILTLIEESILAGTVPVA